ncbi:MAG: type II secretion system F family protein [Candidatus Eremiobacteraeota bacterium]|nr:type II secretion system F family protein [Candidatus Eremiobacteraeota bacterium]MBV8499282.1 type II secretion system F family protein [Candidatus Eremiobacteraeota bacterium]
MVTALVPIAVFAGVSATVFLGFLSVWGALNKRATARVSSLADQLDRAGIKMASQEIVLSTVAGIAIVWIALLFALHPKFLFALLLLPAIAAIAWLGFASFVRFKMAKRLATFVTQLEPATRLMAGGLRVGLGVRQALSIVIDELPDPARHEFRRVIGLTNIGASVYDAMDDMAARMPGHESLMLTRVFRVQSETGGDLARILDQLADTIKDRRQIQRKCSALTAEGRMSAWVLMLIPVGLGLFIVTTQPAMGDALMYTTIGRTVLLVVAGLEVGAFVWLKGLLRMDA